MLAALWEDFSKAPLVVQLILIVTLLVTFLLVFFGKGPND